MADEHTKVEYSFTGNTDGLRKATENALSLLDNYQQKMSSISSVAANASRQISANFSLSLKNAMQDVSQLKQRFSELQSIKGLRVFEDENHTIGVFQWMRTALGESREQMKLLTGETKSFTDAVIQSRDAFANVNPQITGLTESSEGFKSKLQGIKDKISEIRESFKNFFKGQNGDDPFGTIAAKIESFTAKAASAFDSLKEKAHAAITALRLYNGDTGALEDAEGVRSLIGQLGALQGLMGRVSGAAKDKSGALDKETQSTLGDVSATKILSTIFKTLIGNIKGIGSAIAGAGKLIVKFGDYFKNLKVNITNSNGAIKSIVQTLSGVGLGKVLSDAAKSAIAYIENLNLFTVAMGESVDEARAFVEQMSEVYGMDPSNLYRYAGYFYQLSDAIGASSQASKTMSLSLTKAANDIASLFNQDIETVVNNLASGMQGMSRAVRKYGIDIRQTTLQQTALNYGFTENVSTTSEANRQALRYLTIMNQIKNATHQVTTSVDGANKVMGDFARNIETPANQLRILKEQASQVARAFGTFFIPVMQKVLYVINGVLMALKTLLQFIAKLVGIDLDLFGGSISSSGVGSGIVEGAEDAADAVGGIGSAADKTSKKLKNLIAPFDELTILTENINDSLSGGGNGSGGFGGDVLDPGLAAAIEDMSLSLDDILMKANEIRDKILDLLGLELEDGEIKVKIGGFINDLMNLWDLGDYEGFGGRIAEFLNQGIDWALNNIDFDAWSEKINNAVRILAEILNGLVDKFNWGGLGTLIGNGLNLAFGAINTFLDTFNFRNLGNKLAELFEGIINAVNWDLIGTTIGNYFKAKIELGLGFLERVQWKDFGNKLGAGIQAIINTIPWNDLGELFARGINAIFDTLRGIADAIDWHDLGQKLASGLNTMVSTIDWDGIATFFADAITNIHKLICGLVDDFDFVDLGKRMGNGLMTFINGVNWKECGDTIGRLFNGVIDTIRAFLETYEWGSIGASLAQYLNGVIQAIDWHNLGVTVCDAVRSLFREVVNFLSELDWFSIGKGIAEFILAIDWLGLLTDVVVAVIDILGIAVRALLGLIVGIFTGIGKDIVEGFQGGILEGLANIGQWLWDHLVDPVIRAVKGFFGIASPSTVFKEIGGFLIEGLFEGITSALSNIANWIKEHIVDPVVNAVKNFFGISSPSTVFKEIGGFLIEGLFEGIIKALSSVSNWIKEHIVDPILNAVKSFFGINGTESSEFLTIGSALINGLYKGVTNIISGVVNWVKSTITDPLINAVKSHFGVNGSESSIFLTIGSALINGLYKGITTILAGVANWVKSNITDPIVNAVKNFFGISGSTSSIFQQVGAAVVNGLMQGLQTMASKLASWGSELAQTISGIVNNIISAVDGALSWVQSSVSGIVSNISSAASTVSGWASNISRNVQDALNNVSNAANSLSNRSTGVRMATGGVVKGPTRALIGEGRYDEAVIPLGNSPELQEMIDKIAAAVSATPQQSSGNYDRPIEVYVYLDGEQITTSQNRRNRMFGRTQQNI